MIKNIGFRLSIILFVVILVTTVLLVSNGVGYRASKSAIIDHINLQSITVVNNEADKIQRWFESKVVAVDALAKHTEQGAFGKDYVAISKLIKNTSDVSEVLFGFDDGSSYTSANSELFKNGIGDESKYNPTVRPWYKLAQSSTGVVVTDPYAIAGTNAIVISIVKSIDGGAVLVDIDLNILHDTIRDINFAGSATAIFDDNGKPLASNSKTVAGGQSLKDIGMADIYNNMLENRLSVFDYTLDGVDKIGFTREIELVNGRKWYLFFGVDKLVVFSEIEDIFYKSLFSSIFMIIASGIISVLILQQLYKPIGALRGVLHDITQGHGDLIRRAPIRTDDDLNKVSESITAFIAYLQSLIADASHSSTFMVANMKSLEQQANAEGFFCVPSQEAYEDSGCQTATVDAELNQIADPAVQVSEKGEQTMINDMKD